MMMKTFVKDLHLYIGIQKQLACSFSEYRQNKKILND